MLAWALIVIGAIFLLKELGVLAMINWDIIWPVVLIVIGIAMIMRKKTY